MQVLFLKIQYLIILAPTIFGCAKPPDGWNAFTRPHAMRLHPDQRYGADNDWTKGFNDGCVTAMEDLGGIHSLLKPQVDGWKMTGRNPENPTMPHPEIKSAKLYSKGWFDGYEHCTYEYDWWVL